MASLKRQSSPHGSKKSDIGSWFTKRAFSYQSGQGGPAATDHHRETGQALRHCEQAIDHQTEGDVGANAHNVHEPGTSSHGDCSVRVVQDQEIEMYLFSLIIQAWSLVHQVWDYIHTALLCAGAKMLDGPPPRGPHVRALMWASTGPCGS